MTLKKLALATTALTMIAGAGWADSNDATTTQAGAGNSAFVDQSNSIGGFVSLLQSDDRNDADITQIGGSSSSNGNTVNDAQQSAAPGESAAENKLVVLQDGRSNAIQNTFLQEGFKNTSTITQKGHDNRLSQGATIRGSFNELTVVQDGYLNQMGKITQTGASNKAVVNQIGARNNRPEGAFNAAYTVTAPVSRGEMTQVGDNNSTTVDIAGDNNMNGSAQYGTGNKLLIDINGNLNDAGSYQSGSYNDATITQNGAKNVASNENYGNSNIVTITQDGASWAPTGGTATVFIDGNNSAGDSNDVEVYQQANGNGNVSIYGDRNDVRLRQYNGDKATITISGGPEGDDNFLDVTQVHGSTLTVSIYGDDNNKGSFTGGSDAADVAAKYLSGPLSYAGLTPGELVQDGSGNLMEISVGDAGSSSEASSNLFAMVQKGTGNTITGSIMGESNQAVVLQVGASNIADFTQSGVGNNLGVLQ